MGKSGTMAPPRPALDVPVVDLSGPPSAVARHVADACEAWGFFQVVGHGLDEALMRAADREARRFFDRPMASKRALSRTAANPWGYYDRELTKNLRDKKEIFDIGPEGAVGAEGLWATSTPWPGDDEAFRSTLLAYKSACEALAFRLLDVIGVGLRADAAVLRAAFLPASTSFLRLNHHPVADPLADEAAGAAPSADRGIHHHIDSGAVTVFDLTRASAPPGASPAPQAASRAAKPPRRSSIRSPGSSRPMLRRTMGPS
jgi:isopenicillin N synthase-like dioxygenase